MCVCVKKKGVIKIDRKKERVRRRERDTQRERKRQRQREERERERERLRVERKSSFPTKAKAIPNKILLNHRHKNID